MKEQDRIARELGLAPTPEWFVFLPPKGRWDPTRPRCPSALCEAIQYRLRNTRFADFSPHDFRHAHATALLRAGINPKAVAARLGDTVEVLMSTYAHELTGDAEHIASTFAQLVSTKVAISGKVAIPGAPTEHRSRVKLLIEKAA